MYGGPMGMGPMRGPQRPEINWPKSIKEVPSFLKELVGGFCGRLIYVFKLVYETRPWILFVMQTM